MKKKFQFITFSSALSDKSQVQKIVSDYHPCLERIGGYQISIENIEEDIPLYIFILTGGTEQHILEFLLNKESLFENQPAFFIIHPGNNSLPAALEIVAKLKQEGSDGKIFYLNSATDENGLNNIHDSVKFISVRNELRKMTIGLIGKPSDWLVASSPSPRSVSKYWGVNLIDIDLEELENKITEESKENSFAGELESKAGRIIEPQSKDIELAANVYRGLSEIISRYNLNALSLRCFDLVVKNKTTGCIALSQLNDEGIIAGCEGDIVSTIGMLWAFKMTGQQSWMANPARINSSEGILILAHCTVPQSMIKQYNLRSHFESSLGVGIEGEFAEGPVTVFRIGGKKLNKLWIAEGTLVSNLNENDLCRTQVKIELNEKRKLEELLSKPLGNHLIMVYGHHKIKFENYWKFSF